MNNLPDLDTTASVDTKNLYQEESFTDLKVATIRRLTPVLPDGSPDAMRKILYSGHTQIMTPGGALPLQFDIEAPNLAEAFSQFPANVETAINKLAEEMERLQRDRTSRIVSPNDPGGPRLVLPR